MQIRTSTVIAASAECVWPLLCDSKMQGSLPCVFRLGVPQPLECRLVEGQGGVGASRQCISRQGVVNQRIVHWQPPLSLKFEMVDSNLYFRRCVRYICEEFCLQPLDGGQTVLTRTTTIKAEGFAAVLKELLLCLGLKVVHLYVFKNWRRLARGLA